MSRILTIPALAAGLACSVAATEARAQGTDLLGAYSGPYERESGQEFALEFRFGRYIPAVDSDFTHLPEDIRPYEYVFGSSNRFLVALEFDWQLFRIPYVGTLGPAISIGYTVSTAKARLSATPTEFSSQETTLAIMPMYLVAAFRVDVLWNQWGIPIAPYIKGGLGWALWWSKSGGETETVGGVSSKGTSLGWQAALGGALLLDFFDEESAAEMDDQVGVNHSYVFGEWYVSDLSGLGIFDDQMNVGTNTWMVGLMFEF